MSIRDPLDAPTTHAIITDPKHQRYIKWKISRERTTVEGIANAFALLRTGKFETIEQLADAMNLAVPQVRWRLRKGRDRGVISQKFYQSFAE
ncbi:hypothetical protein HFO49_33530 [Rhizobium leguminosarum]|uniref:hypothetical protein n=1 Tax=Rhizobium TaxID=379 RepID=UPI0013E06A2B|nr:MULTISPECIES: hypothetical protein [Rhizobium]MBY5592284.1 hypothetical protein [Rhizobium leguminosarum]MBY5606119.1 hypothetical protein [Rhizobium leguminosarum]NEJ96250.1 hypothetical protein [Rhizobium ruizarguesonis]WSH72193.1 hypothetical protein U8Q02_01250 [Rhizobium leguminosarum]